MFKTVGADEVWLAWTENQDDPLARSFVTARHHAIAALRKAEIRLALGGHAAHELSSILGFFDPRTGVTLADAGRALKAMAGPLS